MALAVAVQVHVNPAVADDLSDLTSSNRSIKIKYPTLFKQIFFQN